MFAHESVVVLRHLVGRILYDRDTKNEQGLNSKVSDVV